MYCPRSGTDRRDISIESILETVANDALSIQNEDGSFPQDDTSFYGDPQLPIRVTSQWLRILVHQYERTGEEEYLRAANQAASYLISDETRPHEYTFHYRNTKKKDKCDGVFGQALPIWSLCHAAEVLERDDLYEVAESVANLIPFDTSQSVWKRVEIDGEILTIDRTLNHQLAYAAAVSKVREYPIQKQVEAFLESLPTLVGVREDGIIRHFVRTPINQKMGFRDNLVSIRNRVLYECYRMSSSMRSKEVSYQAVNLFWLSELKKEFPDHSVWDTPLIRDALDVVETKEFKSEVRKTELAFSDSATGFYIGVALSVFNNDWDAAAEWITDQFEYRYNLHSDLLVDDFEGRMKMASNLCYLAELPDPAKKIPL